MDINIEVDAAAGPVEGAETWMDRTRNIAAGISVPAFEIWEREVRSLRL